MDVSLHWGHSSSIRMKKIDLDVLDHFEHFLKLWEITAPKVDASQMWLDDDDDASSNIADL